MLTQPVSDNCEPTLDAVEILESYERWFGRQAKERELEARFATRCVGAIMPLPTMPNR